MDTLRDFCGSHGRYTFYRSLQYDDVANNRRSIKIGDFVRIRFDQANIEPSKQLYTAEVQLFWTETRNPHRLSSLRIYYPPSYLPPDENDPSLFGRDELLSLPEKVVLKVEDLIRCIKAAQQDDFTILPYNEYCRQKACIRMHTENFSFTCSDWRRNACNYILNQPAGEKRIYFCRREHDYDQLDGLKIRCDQFAPSLRGRKRYKQDRPDGFKKYLLTVSSSSTQLGGWQVKAKAKSQDADEPEKKRLRRTTRMRSSETDQSGSAAVSAAVKRMRKPKYISPYQTRHRTRISSRSATKKSEVVPALGKRSLRRNAASLSATGANTLNTNTSNSTSALKKRTSLAPVAETIINKAASDADNHNGVLVNGVMKRRRGRPRKHPLPVPTVIELDVKVEVKRADDDERPPSGSADRFSSSISIEQSPAAISSVSSSAEDVKPMRKCAGDKHSSSEETSLQILPEYSDEKKQFLRNLIAFMDDIGEPLRREPSLYYTAVDLYELYKLCVGYGGFENMCKRRLWRSAYRQLGGTSKNSAVSSYLKRIYQRVLLRYETHERRGGALSADSVSTSTDADTNSNCNSNADEPAPGRTLRKSVRPNHVPCRNEAVVADEVVNGRASVNGVEPTNKTSQPDKVQSQSQSQSQSHRSSPSLNVNASTRCVGRPSLSGRSAGRPSSDVRNLHGKAVADPSAPVKREQEALALPCANGNAKMERCALVRPQSSTANASLGSNLPKQQAISPGPAKPSPPRDAVGQAARSSAVNLSMLPGMALSGLPLSSLASFAAQQSTATDNLLTQQAASQLASRWLLASTSGNGRSNGFSNSNGASSSSYSAASTAAAANAAPLSGASNFGVSSTLDVANLHPAFPVFCSPAAYQAPLPLLLGLLPNADSHGLGNNLSLSALQNLAFSPAVQLGGGLNNGLMNQLGIAPSLILRNGVNASSASVHVDPMVEYLKLFLLNAHSQSSYANATHAQQHSSQQQLRFDPTSLNTLTANGALLLPKPSGSTHQRARMTEYEST